MNGVRQLWAKRQGSYWGEAMRYLKLIGNSGLLFTIYFLIIVGGYYYQQFLEWLPQAFPVEWVFIILFTYLLTRGGIRSFIKEGDLVFLLPMEGQLDPYIRRSLVYSFILQCGVILLLFVLLAPLFFQRIASGGSIFITTVLLLFIVKLWNVVCKWEEERFNSNRERWMNAVFIRFFANGVFLFLLFHQAHVFYLLALLFIMAVVYQLYYKKIKNRYGLKWEYLLEVEDRMLHTFYRFANLFTDVPKLKERVKGRSYFNGLLSFVPYKQKSTFTYLYFRSFIRANDYLGIYIRLIVIAAVFLYVVPQGILHLIVYFAFIFLSGLQLSTLLQHYQLKLWTDLYPISVELQKRSFSVVVFILLAIQAMILTIFIGIAIQFSPLLYIYLAVGIAFSYIYAFFLVFRKKKKGVQLTE